MRKKLFLLFVLALISFVVFAGCSPTKVGEQVVKNGGMENFEAAAVSDWEVVTNDTRDSSMTTVTFTQDNLSGSDQFKEDLGKRQLKVSVGVKQSTAYLKQSVKLTKGKTYKLSAYVRIGNKIEGIYSDSKFVGARVGFLEDGDFQAINLKNKTDGWQHFEVYFTPATSKALTLVVGIGDDLQGKAKGTAEFDAISINAVDVKAVPVGQTIHTVKYGNTYSLSDAKSTTYTVLGCLIAIIGGYLLYYFIRRQMTKSAPLFDGKKFSGMFSTMALFIYTLLAAFVVRFIIVITLQGQGVDTSMLSNLALKLTDNTLPKFFENSTANNPMGTLYLMWIIGGFAELVNIQFGTIGMGILIRLPMIIADIITCYLVFALASKYYKPTIACAFSAIFALMPLAYTASAAWGMTLSITICLIVATFSAILNKNFIATAILYAFAIMFDYIALIFAPIILAYLIYYFVKEHDKRVAIGVSIASSFIGFMLLTVPFALNYIGQGDVFFIFKKMWLYFEEMAVLNQDVFNFYGAIGLNQKAAPAALVVLNAIFILGLNGLAIYMFLKTKDRLSLLLSASFIMIATAVIGAKATVPMLVLGVMMLFVYAMVSTERRVTQVFAGLSTMAFINVAQISAQSGYLSNNPNMQYLMFNAGSPFIICCSIINLGLMAYLGYLVFDICLRERQFVLQPCNQTILSEIKGFVKRKSEAN